MPRGARARWDGSKERRTTRAFQAQEHQQLPHERARRHRCVHILRQETVDQH